MSALRLRTRVLAVLGLLLLVSGASGYWWYSTTTPDYRFRRAQQAIRKKDYDTAELFASRLAASGQVDLAQLIRGEVFLEEGKPTKALRELNRIDREGPYRIRAATLSGRCLLDLEDRRGAFRAFSFVLEHEPDNVDAHRGAAAIAYDLGNLMPALVHLDRVKELAPQDGRTYRLIGLIQTYLGRDSFAEDAYRAALERDLSPVFRSQVLLELAEGLLRRMDYQGALDQLDLRVKLLGEDDAPGTAIRLESLYALGRREGLIDRVERAMADYPREWAFLALRGQLYLDDSDSKNAILVLERAAVLVPNEYRVCFLLGKAYSAAGRMADAAAQEKLIQRSRANLKKMHDLSYEAMNKPWDAAIRLEIAEVCDDMGNKKLADVWRKAARACKTEE